MDRIVKYKEEEINKSLQLLNNIEIKGISNINNLLLAYQIIQNAIGVEEVGGIKEENKEEDFSQEV